MFVRAWLTLADTMTPRWVPEQPVAMQGEEQIVWRGRWRAPQHHRSKWASADGKVEIVEGISGSDTIVVAGWQRLRDGATRCDRRAVVAPCWRRRYG